MRVRKAGPAASSTAAALCMQMLITVHMLYVEMEANGVHVKTFVDSGAQMTIMTAVRACMRACRGLSLYHTLRSAVQACSTAWCRRCVALWVHTCKPWCGRAGSVTVGLEKGQC